ncbi:MAG: DMT family transporter [Nakamurella sp.]
MTSTAAPADAPATPRRPARPNSRRHRTADVALLPVLALAAVAMIWGVSFAVVDRVTGSMPPADLVAWRFGLGTVVLLLVRRSSAPMVPALRIQSVVLGGLLGAGFLLQAWAMAFTDALMSGFLTSLLVVIAPVVGWLLFRERLAPAAWMAVGLACAGLAVLSLQAVGFGLGELLTLASATLWGLHVVLLSRWSKPQHAIGLARVQTATVTAMAVGAGAIQSAFTGDHPWPAVPTDLTTWLSLGFLAVLATAAAMVLLSWSQSRINATRAAVILTVEPIAAGVTAAILGAELTARTVIGATLLLGAMFIVELPDPRNRLHDRPEPRAFQGSSSRCF